MSARCTVAISLVLVACSSFGADTREPSSIADASTPEAAPGTTPVDGPFDDGGLNLEPADGGGGTYLPLPASPCKDRVPPYTKCLDFESSLDPPPNEAKDGRLGIEPGGSDGAGHALVARLYPNKSGYAHVRQTINCAAATIAWSFDVLVSDELVDTTELNQLLIVPTPADDVQAIQIKRAGGVIEVNDFDATATGSTENRLATHTLPTSATPTWVTIMVALAPKTRAVTSGIRYAGVATFGSGTLRRPITTPTCELQIGGNYVNKQNVESILRIDNVAWLDQ